MPDFPLFRVLFPDSGQQKRFEKAFAPALGKSR
jgi:hypothetical protein